MDSMTNYVSIKYFSILAEITGRRKEERPLTKGQSVEQILKDLTSEFPEMQRYVPHIRAAVNQNYQPLDYQPENRDEIVFITPVSGG